MISQRSVYNKLVRAAFTNEMIARFFAEHGYVEAYPVEVVNETLGI